MTGIRIGQALQCEMFLCGGKVLTDVHVQEEITPPCTSRYYHG